MTPQPEIWIGLVEVRPFDPKVYGAGGAFTYIVTWATCPLTFRQKAEKIAAHLNMYVAGIEGAEPVWDSASRCTLNDVIKEMIGRAQSNPNAIIYGTFHQYPSMESADSHL